MKPISFLVCTLSLLLLVACGTVEDYLKGDDNAEPPTPLTPVSATVSLRTVWSDAVGKGGYPHFVNLRPALRRGRLYIANHEGSVIAYDAVSGDQVWQVNVNVRLGGGPGIAEDLVVVGSRDGEVIALDAGTGKEKWRSRVTSEILSVPTGAAGVVVTRAIDGRVFGMSSVDGKRLWVFDRTVPVLTLRGSSSPVIVGGLVIYGSDGGRLTALTLKEGVPVWEKSVAFPAGRSELDRIVDIDGDPLVINGVLYAASYQGRVVALDVETATLLWSRDIVSSSGLTADSDNIYLTDNIGHVLALDRRSGTTVWKQDRLLHRHVTGPVFIGRYVVVGDREGYLHWLSRNDGALVGRIQPSSAGISSQPVVSEDMLYTFGNGGDLSAIRFQ